MAKIHKWTMNDICNTIYRTLNNKFDFFIIIEGNRGLGKSTLALKIARRISRLYRKKGSKEYRFNWNSSLIYTKKETKRFWNKWHSVGIGDEMINVAFNRDFYNSEQKDIIKMVNMNRDHRNLFIACVPEFQNLDNQIKNLCKMRITVVRRGLAIIQTQNRTIYIKDKWDTATNEKLERQWLQRNMKNPAYAKLTTFRGVLRFGKLSLPEETKYQEIKDLKRNLVAKEEMGIESDEDDSVDKMIKMLKNGEVKNGTFIDGFALANGVKPSTFQNNIRARLKERGESPNISSYYWEKKAQILKEITEERSIFD